MVRSFVKRGLSVIASKQTNIFSAAFFIILTTFISQVLGWLKYRLLASQFGASSEVGVFIASFRIPDFIFQVLIAGALTSAFIPVFSKFVEHHNEKEGYKFASTVASLGLVAYCVIAIPVIIFPYFFSSMIVPGYSHAEISLMANLTRVIMLAQIFFILGTIATGILQTFHRFLVAGVASALYNVGIILGIIFLAPSFGIYGVTIGALFGAFLFFFVQIPFVYRMGFKFIPRIRFDEDLKKLLKLMLPRSLTLLLTQISISASVYFTSFISARSLVIFDYAQTLMLAPVILFGQSIAQASFPALVVKRHDEKEFLSILVASFNQILYLTLPLSVLLIVLRIPIVRLFYGADRFDWQATLETGMTLAFFAVSIIAQALIYLLSRAFYAFKDAQTPFLITLISVIVNVFLSFIFIMVLHLPVFYLALSFSVANVVSIILLIIFINLRVKLPLVEIGLSVSKILVATLTMGFALYIPIKLLDQLVFDTTRTINLFILTGISSLAGLCSFLFFTWLLDIKEVYYIFAVIKKFSSRHKILKQLSELIDLPTHNP